MTSTNQTSSGGKANLVSSSPELLTRPASKPDDRSNSSTGELRTGSANQLPSPRGRGVGEGVLYSTSLSFYTPVAVPPSFPFACFVYFVVKKVPKLNVASRSACSA